MSRHTNSFEFLDEEDSDDVQAVVQNVVAKITEKERREAEERAKQEAEKAALEAEKRRIKEEEQMKLWEEENGPIEEGWDARGRGRGGRGGDFYGRGNGCGGGNGQYRGRGGRFNGGRGYVNGDQYDNRGYHNGGGNGAAEMEGDRYQEGGNRQYQNGNGYHHGGRGNQWRGQGNGFYREEYYVEGENQYYDDGYQGAPNGDGYNGERRGFRGDEGQQGQGNGRYVNRKWVPKDGTEKTVAGSNDESKQTDNKSPEPEGAESKDQSKPVEATGKPETMVQEDDDRNKMTLDEYEKIQLEKRKAVEVVKPESRKVDVKAFEGMQPLVCKKKEDDSPPANAKTEEKLNEESSSEKEEKVGKKTEEKLNKKSSSKKEEKVGKVVNMREFLQLAGGQRFNGRFNNNQYNRGGFQGGYRGDGRGNGRGRGNYGYRNEELQDGEQRNGGYRGGYNNGYNQGGRGGYSNGYNQGRRGRGNGVSGDGHPDNKVQVQQENGNSGPVNGDANGAPKENQAERTNGDSGRPSGQDRVQHGNGRGRGFYPPRPAGNRAPLKLEDQEQFPTLG